MCPSTREITVDTRRPATKVRPSVRCLSLEAFDQSIHLDYCCIMLSQLANATRQVKSL